MATKKSLKKESSNSFDIQKLMQNSDSYKSLVYGIVTVVVLFIVIALGVRTLQQNRAMIDEEAVTTQNVMEESQGQYTVMEGDTLWSIAEKKYNDGFKWEEIAKANNITEATTLEKGTKLKIPQVEKVAGTMMEEASPEPTTEANTAYAISPTVIPVVTTKTEPVPMQSKISGQKYTIVEGDTLWDIAVRAYGDGYRWVEISNSNELVNPDLIYTGDSLNIPRP